MIFKMAPDLLGGSWRAVRSLDVRVSLVVVVVLTVLRALCTKNNYEHHPTPFLCVVSLQMSDPYEHRLVRHLCLNACMTSGFWLPIRMV